MPERSFRVIIQNSSSFTLNQTFNHLCGGDWTPGGWVPPGSISPNTSGGMQSESDGIATGTEGYVKYDVNRNVGGSNTKVGMIYVYWDNPFYGYTHFRFAAAPVDVFPDCDFDAPSGGATFSDSSDLSFSLSFSDYAHGEGNAGHVPALGDFVHYAVGPVSLFGLVGIDQNPILYLKVTDHTDDTPDSGGPVPTFEDLGPEKLVPLPNATPEQWAGRWGSGKVSLNISLTDTEPPLLATISDNTTTPSLSFTETFTPGPDGLLLAGAALIDTLSQSHAQDHTQQVALNRAARVILRHAAITPISPRAVVSSFQSIVGNLKSSTPTSVAIAKTQVVGKAIANLLKDKGGVAYLSNHVALRLFRVAPSAIRCIQFQRLNALGHPISSVMLNTIQDIR
jgi:hypothetical protein